MRGIFFVGSKLGAVGSKRVPQLLVFEAEARDLLLLLIDPLGHFLETIDKAGVGLLLLLLVMDLSSDKSL